MDIQPYGIKNHLEGLMVVVNIWIGHWIIIKIIVIANYVIYLIHKIITINYSYYLH